MDNLMHSIQSMACKNTIDRTSPLLSSNQSYGSDAFGVSWSNPPNPKLPPNTTRTLFFQTINSGFDGGGGISISEDDSRNIDWDQIKELLHLTRDELDEFQASSQELEEELENEWQRTERAQRELDDQVRRLEVDRDNWQAKFIQSNNLVNKLQLEVTTVRQTIVTYKSQVVELEMGNDDSERNERAAAESVKELESQLNRIMEEKILLEERSNEIIVLQRKISLMPVVSLAPVVTGSPVSTTASLMPPASPAPVLTSSPIATAASSPVVARDLELKDLPPSPTTSTLASSTSSRLPQRQQSLRPRLSFSTATPPPRPSLSRPPPSRGLSLVNDMRNKTRALQTKLHTSRDHIHLVLQIRSSYQLLGPCTRRKGKPAATTSATAAQTSAVGRQYKVRRELGLCQQPWMGSRANGGGRGGEPGGRYTKDSRAPRVKDVFTPTPIQARARAILRPRHSDSDSSRPEITPLTFGGFGLGMRSGSRASGRSFLSSASEAESGGERFGSLGKAARLSFTSESDSDLDAILKIWDSTDTVKATPKPNPRHSVPARTLSREDPRSSDVYPESPMCPDLDAELMSPTESVGSSASSKSNVKSKVVGAMSKYLRSSAPKTSTTSQPQVKGESKNEIKFPSRLGHKRSQSMMPASPQQPIPPSPTAIPAYARRTFTDAIRVFTNSTPSTNPPRSSVPMKYAGLPAAIPLECGTRSVSSSESVVSPINYYPPRTGEARRVSGSDMEA
ncbi:NADH:ubiquinone oxidoreductase [Tulasnella sp. UAMH 9824]|nr:NADH:ubiquinone oxidoreductase [Tulasnella sp. UAMH 9824]